MGRWVRPENSKLLFSAQNAFAHMNAPTGGSGIVPLPGNCLNKRRPVITTSNPTPTPAFSSRWALAHQAGGTMALSLPELAASEPPFPGKALPGYG